MKCSRLSGVDGPQSHSQEIPRLVESGDAGLVLDAVQDVVLVNGLVAGCQLNRPGTI